MHTQNIIQLEDRYQVPTYNKYPIALARGEGDLVWDTEGKRYIDFYGGHCVTVLGHCPPRVVQAIQQQAKDLIFYSNVVYSPVRARAAELVATMAPPSLKHVYFCNSGTEANETALKMARTFTGKHEIVAIQDGFHGRTLGSLAATGIDKYRHPYGSILPPARFIPFGSIEAAEQTFAAHSDIAAVILEPIQSMAGILEADIEYYRQLRTLCDAHGACLIYDEVQTGVGRTGTFSISERYDVFPDLITMAKSLGSGIPVGSVMVADRIAETVHPGDHGSTFGGGMIAMAALTATLETIRDENLMDRAALVFDTIRGALEPHVAAIRGRGCLIGVALETPVKPVIAALREAGILVGSSMHPHVIRLMPPLNTSEESLHTVIDTFIERVSTSEVV